MNSNEDNVFTLILVEHLIMNSIDRLGDYLVMFIPFLQEDYYDCAVELSEESIIEYSYVAEPPVRFRLSHLFRRSE